MPLYLITGLPGTGKSTVNAELKARGYESYDGDEDHLAKWFDKNGNPVRLAPRTREFVFTHTRGIARKTVEKLATRAVNKPIFLCNDPDNEDELRDLFAKIFALVLDEKVRLDRLATRTNNNWGKLPHELEHGLMFVQKAPETYRKFKYVTINASRPPNIIVDHIIQQAGL